MIFSGMLECDYLDLKWRFEMYQTLRKVQKNDEHCEAHTESSGSETNYSFAFLLHTEEICSKELSKVGLKCL